jgi:hypothetical protein
VLEKSMRRHQHRRHFGLRQGTHFFVVAGGQQENPSVRLSWTLATSAGDVTTSADDVPTGYAPVTHRASDTALVARTVAGRGDVLARDTDFGTAEGWPARDLRDSVYDYPGRIL